MTQTEPGPKPAVLYRYKRIKAKPGRTRGRPVGIVAAALVDGKLRLGWSLMNPTERAFDVALGRKIALNRALQPGKPYLHIVGCEWLRAGYSRLPDGTRTDTPDRLIRTEAQCLADAQRYFKLSQPQEA